MQPYIIDSRRLIENFKAFFEGRAYTKVVLQALAPKEHGGDHLKETEEQSIIRLVDRGENPIRVLELFERSYPLNHYVGDAFPNFYMDFGPAALLVFMDIKPIVKRNCIGFDAKFDLNSIEKILNVKFKGCFWDVGLKLLIESCRRAYGKFMVSVPNLGGLPDIPFLVRGVEGTILDMLRKPNKLHEILDNVFKLWFEAYDTYSNQILNALGAMSCWMGVLFPGRGYPVDCDMSIYMTERLFEEFAFKYLANQCELLEYPVYHLDGPEALRHLKRIIQLPGLKAIQWSPGESNPGPEDPKWFHIYKTIHNAGLNLILLNVPSQSVESLIKMFGNGRTLISTKCVSKREAERLAEIAGYAFN